jgi:hypothetical protein
MGIALAARAGRIVYQSIDQLRGRLWQHHSTRSSNIGGHGTASGNGAQRPTAPIRNPATVSGFANRFATVMTALRACLPSVMESVGMLGEPVQRSGMIKVTVTFKDGR